ncbi:CBS domain-containing protein [Streptomyces mutabilis]|uniref:CBS domain-containing protein n=1 Tax=Streptomyces TaxID=1883 RepID=UPI0027843F44|nr:putative transcriptional regulator [Streptomyces sp. DSM 42143]
MAEYVREVMTRGVTAVRPDSSVVEAAQPMRTQNIGDVVVADGQDVVGLVTDPHDPAPALADTSRAEPNARSVPGRPPLTE